MNIKKTVKIISFLFTGFGIATMWTEPSIGFLAIIVGELVEINLKLNY